MLPDPLPLPAYCVYGAGGILFRQTPSVNVLLELSYGQIAGLSREVHPGQGVAAGEEPQPQIRLEIGLGGSLLQAGPQLVQERRAFAVGDDLELGGDPSGHELTPTPRSGIVGSGGGSGEDTSELQSRPYIVWPLLLLKKKKREE